MGKRILKVITILFIILVNATAVVAYSPPASHGFQLIRMLMEVGGTMST